MGPVEALQSQKGATVHPGGKSALKLYGSGHSQKQIKRSQYVDNPPNLEQIEKIFLDEIKLTLI